MLCQTARKNKGEEIEKDGGGNAVFFCSHCFVVQKGVSS